MADGERPDVVLGSGKTVGVCEVGTVLFSVLMYQVFKTEK
jgi:hypothetical protein